MLAPRSCAFSALDAGTSRADDDLAGDVVEARPSGTRVAEVDVSAAKG